MIQRSSSIESSPQQDGDQQILAIIIKDYLNVLQKRKRIILTVLVLVFLLFTIKTYSETEIYTAGSQVLIERYRSSKTLGGQYFSYEPNFLNTQSAIIRSANVAKRVVANLQLDTKYAHHYFKEKQDDSPSVLRTIKLYVKELLNGLKGKTNDETTVKKESNNKVESGERPKLKKGYRSDAIASIIQSGLSIKPVRNTKIVNITYNDKNPLMAKLIANGVVQAYMDEILEIKLATSNYTLQWMTKKSEEERVKLQKAETKLQKYMRDNDLVTIEDKLAIYPQKLSSISAQLLQAQTERKEMGSLVKKINSLGKNSRALESVSVFAQNNILDTLREQIYKSKQNIKELSKKYGVKHPAMIKAKDEHDTLLNEKRLEIERIVESTKSSFNLAKTKEKNLQELQLKAKAELLDLNEKFIQFSIMKREVDANRILYDALTSSAKHESVTEQTHNITIWVIRKAALPGAPSKPDKKRSMLFGLVLGIVGGVGLAFFVEFLDNTIKKEKDLEERFGLTVLGTVDEIGGEHDIETYMVHKPLSPLSESYRLIRSGILLSSAEQPPKTILTTSMGPREGKTSTTINLARILAQNKMKVLVIDCDMRKPRLHKVFDMPNDVGLSNYLSGTSKENILHTVPGGDITVITAGSIPPNPAELLTSNKMKLLLEKMKEVYDHILLDSPPIQSVTDALTVSTLVDGTIIVVRAGKTTYESLESGLKKIRDVNGHILGFVLNALRKSDSVRGYYYGYGYGYSKYYAKDDNIDEKS